MSEADKKIFDLIKTSENNNAEVIVEIGNILIDNKCNSRDYILALKNVAGRKMTWPRNLTVIKQNKDTDKKSIEIFVIPSPEELENKLKADYVTRDNEFDISQDLIYCDGDGIHFCKDDEYTDSNICFILSKP